MHIAVFIFGLTGGGATRRTLALAEGFAAKGHEVDMVVIDGTGPLAASVPETVRLIRLEKLNPFGKLCIRGKRRRRIFLAQPALAQYLRIMKPDCLMSAANHINLAAIGACRFSRTDTPLIIRISNHITASLKKRHGLKKKLRYLAVKGMYRYAQAVITVSDGIAADVADVANIGPELITTIYNPVFTSDLALRASQSVDHPWLNSTGCPVILAAGRLAAQKDFITLVRAFAMVRERTDARLIILGEGKQRGKIQAAALAANVTDHVDMPGYVDNPLAWMAKASIFCLSSAWEGLPGVLIEAMSTGCPVVSTDCPSGPAEILENGRYGLLVPPGDFKAMADALVYTLESPPQREKLVDRASYFSVDRSVNQYLKLLARVCKMDHACMPASAR